MKRRFLFTLIAAFLSASVYAYRLETIREYPFDDVFGYFETWIDDKGYTRPGLVKLFVEDDKIYAFSASSMTWVTADTTYKKNEFGKSGSLVSTNGTAKYFISNDGIKLYLDKVNPAKCDYDLTFPEEIYMYSGSIIYQTENYVFAQTGHTSLISWELQEDGKSQYRDSGETYALLAEGLSSKLGIEYDGYYIYFGEFNISDGSYPNSRNIWQTQTFKTEGYEKYENLSSFHELGTTKEGLGILYRTKNNGTGIYALEDPNHPITLLIAVLDPWTREVNVIELEAGCWNPPRNSNGLIAAMSQCIDEDGNVYFTDCNKGKKCYEIKKLSNEWLKEYDFYKIPVGRMKANHIALEREAKEGEENNGYNYDHEYLRILAKNGEWLKVRKVDGREGWVNTQYVTINEGVDLTTIPEEKTPEPEPVAPAPAPESSKPAKKSRKGRK